MIREVVLLALKMEGRTMSGGIWVASRSRKRQGGGYTPTVSRRKCKLADILILSSGDLDWNSDLRNARFVLL